MITLRQIHNHDYKVHNDFRPCDEGWFFIDFATGVKKIFLKTMWEGVPVNYRDCSIRIEDTPAARYLFIDDYRLIFDKGMIISWLGGGEVKFQREVRP